MKSLFHITEDVSRASGGIRTVVNDIHKHFPKSTILTTNKDKQDQNITAFEKKGPWLYSPALKNHLEQLPANAMFHLHGVWMHAQYAAAKIASQKKIPFIVSPHGMYEPWLWKDGVVKKKLYFKLLTSSAFAKANYIHAITPEEKSNLQKLFPKSKIVCIPNAIEMQPLPVRKLVEKPYFLFLGRIHPKKGVQLLIEVFSMLKELDFDLKIAGSPNEYSRELKRKVNGLNDSRIQFIGEVHGAQKQQLYRNAHAFVAPSFSEVVGMVNLEAAMMATPVITTFETGLLKDWNLNGGILVHPDFENLKDAIIQAAQWEQPERDERGLQLREFVKRNYSWETILPQWTSLYKSMVI
ncbi:glycosyltransferase [Nonlabens antarcticus]|uniref:glycosyltransferase n=1 Tax=Nonlabens antarcticus TaxID=392714 RepID=UPI00189197DF|nr:glycosyltransferase [Nonlabens antarcticus]